MKPDALISVIVPVYKVEAYLYRCVDSILAQTYQNLEIILVDDGSPDRCGEICDQYAAKDKRVIVFHKQNEGVSVARNYGTARASGEYIAFIDSDDYIAEDYVEYLFELLTKNEADISLCPIMETNNDNADFMTTYGIERIIPGKSACGGISGYNHISYIYIYHMVPFGKLIKKEIAEKYLFPKGRRHEDEATVVKYYYDAKRVAVGNRCLYAYFQNPNGFMNSLGDEKNIDKIWALAHAAEFFEGKNETKIAKKCWRRYFAHCLRDSVKHNDYCYDDIKNYAKIERLDKKMIIHVPIYLVAPKLYGVFARAHLKRHSQK